MRMFHSILWSSGITRLKSPGLPELTGSTAIPITSDILSDVIDERQSNRITIFFGNLCGYSHHMILQSTVSYVYSLYRSRYINYERSLSYQNTVYLMILLNEC